MPWTSDHIASDLHALGLRSGDSVLTHSSFKSLGKGGTPNDLISAIFRAVGPEGTAIFPTHTWATAFPESPPTFDVRTTSSALIGTVPEHARVLPGGVRSVHPTHSVIAFGANAGWVTEAHYDGGLCGIDSPYERLCRMPTGTGYILLLGVDHERNTSLHMPEELRNIPGALTVPVMCPVTGYDGVERMRESRFHIWSRRRFMVIDEEADQLGIQRKGKVGEAECRLIDAEKLRDLAMERLSENPNYFWAPEE